MSWAFHWRNKLDKGWDQDFVPKAKRDEWQSLFTSDVSEYDSVPRIEHLLTSVAVAKLPSVARTTVTGYEIWQLTRYKFSDEYNFDNCLSYQSCEICEDNWT